MTKHPVLIFGFLLAGFLLGGAVSSDDQGLFGPVVAAWVQAVGSIAAISAAIWIAGAEARRARKTAHAIQLGRLSVVGALGLQLVQAVEKAEEEMDAGRPHSFDHENLDSILEALREVSLVELVNARVAVSVINLRRAAYFYRRAYEEWGKVARRKRRREAEEESQALEQLDPFHNWEAFQVLKLEGLRSHLAKLKQGIEASFGEIDEEYGKAVAQRA